MSASVSPLLSGSGLTEEFDSARFDVDAFAVSALADWQSLAAIIDQTVLRPDVTSADVLAACQDTLEFRFACMVVNPCWVALAGSALAGSGMPVGTVIGFPFGASLTRTKREETEAVLRLGAQELDMVLNIGALKSRDNTLVQSDVRAVVEVAHNAGAIVKVILETCLLTLEEKLRASELCVSAGVDFLKTSTGFSSGGATVEDIRLLRGVAGGHCGVKASGGIRTLAATRNMIEAGASRIGTSVGAAIVQSYREQADFAENLSDAEKAPR